MQTITDIISEWPKLKERGDVNAIAALIGKEHTTTSRILNGHQTPTIDEIEIIEQYFAPRKKKIQKLLKK